MKRYFWLYGLICLLHSPLTQASLTCNDVAGASVFSSESVPRYLGFVGSDFAQNSINNDFGPYGSEFRADSVRNESGTYGSPSRAYQPTTGFLFNPQS